MKFNVFCGNSFSHLVGITIAATAVFATIAPIAIAKSSEEIGQIAAVVTVQINNDLMPGGSGVIIARNGNSYTVLTASHVVCERRQVTAPCREDITYTIRTHTGRDYPVTHVQTLLNSENDPDLAIVTFESSDEYSVATLGDSDAIVLGSPLYVSGFLFTQNLTGTQRDLRFTDAVTSSRRQNPYRGYTIVYNADTWSGMSGGPVFNSEGRVVGIHGQGEVGKKLEFDPQQEAAIIETGYKLAIPMNTFITLSDRVGLNPSNLTINDSPLQDNGAERIANPRSEEDYNNRGLVRAFQGDYAGAMADFNTAIERNSNHSEAYFNRGNLYFQQGDYSRAIADFTAAIEHNPNYSLAYGNRAYAYIRIQDYQNAIADWTRSLELNPGEAKTYFNLGLAHYRIGNYQGAIDAATQGVTLECYAPAYNLRADARVDQGDSAAALEDYSKAIECDPSYAIAYNNRATIYAAQQNQQSACQDLRTAAQLFLDQKNMGQQQQVMGNIRLLRCP